MTHFLRAFALVGVALMSSLVEGHTPARLHAGEPFIVQNPKDSYGLYGEFTTGDELFVVRSSKAIGGPLPSSVQGFRCQTMRRLRRCLVLFLL